MIDTPSTGRRTMTLVFNINDMAALERDHPNLKELAMKGFDKDAPYSLAGMSTGNEVLRSNMISHVLEMREDRKLDKGEALDMIEQITHLYEPEEFEKFNWNQYD